MKVQSAFSNPGIRMGIFMAAGLLVLVALAAIIRPQMLSMAMVMAHDLILGFGL